jgi:thiamine biosynthesis protein ThiI
MFDSIVIHYSEIGTKGKNRDFFEKQLMDNVKSFLGEKVSKVYRRGGRIICDVESLDGIENVLKFIPGVANFSFAMKCELDYNDIQEKVFYFLKDADFSTFKVVTSRSNKNFKMNSDEVNRLLGERVILEFNKKVKMVNPDLNIFVEIGEKEAFVFFEKIQGIGGLPVGSSGKIISSLSGGIDSPVASYLMMKRGCKVVFVHIYNQTQVDRSVLSKIDKIVNELTKFQGKSKLYVVPFANIQKQIIMNVPSKYRMIIYRRFMFRIMNLISQKEKTKAFVTGDSVGQVASQTLENINSIYDASGLPILCPLIGMNKEEIVEISKFIGTYEHSIIPFPDCCSFMIAQHPETKSRLEDIKKIEDNIENIDELVASCVEEAEVKNFG